MSPTPSHACMVWLPTSCPSHAPYPYSMVGPDWPAVNRHFPHFISSAQSRTFWGLDKEEATHKFVTGMGLRTCLWLCFLGSGSEADQVPLHQGTCKLWDVNKGRWVHMGRNWGDSPPRHVMEEQTWDWQALSSSSCSMYSVANNPGGRGGREAAPPPPPTVHPPPPAAPPFPASRAGVESVNNEKPNTQQRTKAGE